VVERVELEVESGYDGLTRNLLRYGLLERVRRFCEKANVVWLAFGVGERGVRLVLDGEAAAIAGVIKRLKIGTVRDARQARVDLYFRPTVRVACEASGLEDAVIWAHRGAPWEGAGPLSTPWTSHRDLLGYRIADFFDANPLRARVDADRLHRRAGGRSLPSPTPELPRTRESLPVLLRMAAAVRGLDPSDRRCFRLFVHLAEARGWTFLAMARALALTDRRVRQLASEAEDHLDLAMVALGDDRLAIVP
jgi:hypothetical protein